MNARPWLLVPLLAACGGADPAPPVEPAPAAPFEGPRVSERRTAPAIGEDTRYVLASSLNLRAAPGGAIVGKLDINAPVRLLAVEGEHARVRAANGREGTVPAEFLAAEPLTLAEALSRHAGATSPAERLSWAQRAAAIDERARPALEALAAAYREAGDAAQAEAVERRLSWPDDLLLAGAWPVRAGELLRLEWGLADSGLGWETEELPESELARRGLVLGGPVWVLPDRGPALRGEIAGLMRTLFNECGGTMGHVLLARVELPPGARPIAFSVRVPPESWSRTHPERDLDAAVEAVREVIAPRRLPDAQLHAAAYGDGVRVRVAANLAGPEDEMQSWTLLDFDVEPGGVVRPVEERSGEASFTGYLYPSVGRDIDGDGRGDLVLEGLCMQVLIDADGVTRRTSESLCCGC